MAYFLCRLSPPRADFMQTMTVEEFALMGEHIAYWRGLEEPGIAVAFGPVADPAGAWGMGLVEVADRAEIERLAAADPAIRANRGFSYDIHDMPRGIMGRAANATS